MEKHITPKHQVKFIDIVRGIDNEQALSLLQDKISKFYITQDNVDENKCYLKYNQFFIGEFILKKRIKDINCNDYNLKRYMYRISKKHYMKHLSEYLVSRI